MCSHAADWSDLRLGVGSCTRHGLLLQGMAQAWRAGGTHARLLINKQAAKSYKGDTGGGGIFGDSLALFFVKLDWKMNINQYNETATSKWHVHLDTT